MFSWMTKPPAVLTLTGWGSVGSDRAVLSIDIHSCRESVTAEGDLGYVYCVYPTGPRGEGVAVDMAGIVFL